MREIAGRRGLRMYRAALGAGVVLRRSATMLYWMPPYCVDDAQLALMADATAVTRRGCPMRLTRSHVAMPLAVGQEVVPGGCRTWCARCARSRGCLRAVQRRWPRREARIVAAGVNARRADVLSARRVDNEGAAGSPCCGHRPRRKMDWILQRRPRAFRASCRSTASAAVKLDAARAQNWLAHWREVVVAACEQSGRAVVPDVLPPQALAQTACRCARTRSVADNQGAGIALATLGGQAFDACTLAIGPADGRRF